MIQSCLLSPHYSLLSYPFGRLSTRSPMMLRMTSRQFANRALRPGRVTAQLPGELAKAIQLDCLGLNVKLGNFLAHGGILSRGVAIDPQPLRDLGQPPQQRL